MALSLTIGDEIYPSDSIRPQSGPHTIQCAPEVNARECDFSREPGHPAPNNGLKPETQLITRRLPPVEGEPTSSSIKTNAFSCTQDAEVEHMGIVYWQDEANTAFIATNMQAVAINKDLWDAYASYGSKGRAVFQQCATDTTEWSFDTVMAYAANEENPPAPPVAAAPPIAAVKIVRPRGGASKWVRLPADQFTEVDAAMVKRVKGIARNRK